MDIFNTLTPEAMAMAIEQQMKVLAANGGSEVVRLQKELESSPKDAELWFELGVALNQAGLQYDDLAARLAELRYGMEFPDEVLEEPQEVIPLNVDVSEGNKLYNYALEAFDRVLELQPDYYGVACQRGIVYGNLLDYPHAEECYLQALKDDEEDFTAAYYLSMVYRDMGKEELADKYMKLSEELNDGEPLE